MYVSTSGNDTLAAASGVYTQATHPDWGNPFNPSGTIQPFATVQAAYAHVRSNYPDWILIKRGDVFTGTVGGITRDGKSLTEPQVIGAYGASGPPPLFKCGTSQGFEYHGWKKYFAVFGLEFYAHTRDPESPDYTGVSGASGMFLGGGGTEVTTGVLIEGCKFRFFPTNGSVNYYNKGGGLTIRRCVFLDSYSGGGPVQGLILTDVNEGVIVEENIFDHNGWLMQNDNTLPLVPGEATDYNQNLYIENGNNIALSNNIFMRASSIGSKFAVYTTSADPKGPFSVINNLYIDGEVGITMAGANTSSPLRVLGATVTGNVITNLNRSRSQNRNIGWGIDLLDIDGGTVAQNIIVHNNASNSHGMQHIGYSRNLTIDSNVIYDFQNLDYGVHLESQWGTDSENVVFSNNKIQIPLNAGYTINSEFDPTGKWTFSNNKYYSDSADGARFMLSGASKTDAQWADATGDTSFPLEQVTFPDPTRSVETYLTSIGESTATIDRFIELARAQDRFNWNPQITAEPVNSFIRVGFDLEDLACSNTPSMCTTELLCEGAGWFWYDDECHAFDEPADPTCSDLTQNGDETGIDCGGSCPACDEPTAGALHLLRLSDGVFQITVD